MYIICQNRNKIKLIFKLISLMIQLNFKEYQLNLLDKTLMLNKIQKVIKITLSCNYITIKLLKLDL